ncbi:MAG: sugar ABC transporter permease [Planctomycetes bacterium]|nr:sugar ABC transporter permease [Planctomycetota bacterium]
MTPIELRKGERYLPSAFLFPGLLFYSVFLIIPLGLTFFASFTQWEGFSYNNLRFNGIQNYVDLLKDEIFIKSVKNNFYLIFTCAIFSVLIGFVLSVLLEFELPLSKFIRGLYFVPSVMSMIVIGIIFTLFFSPDLGLINPIMKKIGLSRFAGRWLGDPKKALGIMASAEVWRTFGFNMFLFVAGMKSLPVEQLEASLLDGAKKRHIIRYIIIPNLKQVFIVTASLAIINALKLFDFIYVMTFGGPNHATQVMTTWLYFQGFTWNNVGYASSIGVVLTVLIFVISYFFLRISGGFKDEN